VSGWDQSLDAGEAFDHATEKALEQAGAVVVLWSARSVESRWVRAEATQADRAGKLVPVEIGPCKRPIMFELTQTADLARWAGDPADQNWQALVAGLRRQLGRGNLATPDSQAVTASSGQRRFGGLAIAFAALLLAGVVGFALTRDGGKAPLQRESAVTPTGPAGGAAIASPVTLAVLPFVNLSSDPEQEYFSDGLTEEILNHLAQVQDLQVTGRTSSFSFKGKNEDLRVIGEKLGVANLLEGSIRKDGDQLRITAQLIDARTGGHLWSHTYDRDSSGVFKMQEEVARDVAKALSIKLEVGELAGRPGMTRNIEAFDAYLAAAKFNEPDADSLRAAMALLERATVLDPAFVNAWANLANIYWFASSSRMPGNTPDGWAARSDAILERIKGISEYGQAVHEALAGDRSQNQWDMVDAQKHFDNSRAIAQKLGLAVDLTGEDAVFVLVTGRFSEAIAILERAKVADPLNSFIGFLLPRAFAATGNLPAAIAESDRGMQLEGFQIPLRGSAVLIALATRDKRLIDKRLTQMLEVHPDASGFISAMKSRLDDPTGALAEVRRRAKTSTDHVELSAMAVWMAWLGDSAGALEIYRKNEDLFRSARRGAALFDIWNPVLHDMRQLPGFKDLVRTMGLVDYWRTYGWSDLCKPVGEADFECS
jgi:TolB-like protein